MPAAPTASRSVPSEPIAPVMVATNVFTPLGDQRGQEAESEANGACREQELDGFNC
jgi:hypothetical protein